MEKILCKILLTLSLVTLATCQSSLLEMSQELWMKLLEGGLSKVGKLDPLRVPVVKVDQSEGDTSYRMILRNVEILGLNESTLESIHIARGRLKSNLSELEAGYVSYSDLRDLDAIRYRFHTLIKEPKGAENDSFEAIVSATNRENKFKSEASSSRYQDDRTLKYRQYDPFLLKLQSEQMKDDRASQQQTRADEKRRNEESGYGSFSMGGARVIGQNENTRGSESARYPTDSQLMYAISAVNAEINRRNYEQQRQEDSNDCRSNCQRRSGSYSGANQGNSRQTGRREEELDEGRFGGRFGGRFSGRYEEAQASASERFETRTDGQGQRVFPGPFARNEERREEATMRNSGERRPGYIDIVYADGKNNGSLKRFGNMMIESKYDAKVYSMEDAMKDIRENRRFMSHNFTEGESLRKRFDAIRTAMESQRLQDLMRYAKDFQEKQGYFEEGMQLVYHYGGMTTRNSEDLKNTDGSRRLKRAHKEDEIDEDVMHVIMKIRVPFLRVKSEYQLMGKVGKEYLRGNGQLKANFTELVGDFTIELKRTKDNLMIVRAARSKLLAKTQNIDLQGMDEEGPVKSVLSRGLMAAEAVAAMLADDLATKALNDKTADAMIYRMYKNLPAK